MLIISTHKTLFGACSLYTALLDIARRFSDSGFRTDSAHWLYATGIS